LWRAWRKSPRDLLSSVDRWFTSLDREIYLSMDLLYSQLRLIVRQLRSGSALFKTPPLHPGGLSTLLDLPADQVEQAILHPAFGLLGSLRTDPPP